MALAPHIEDENREAELERKTENPHDFGDVRLADEKDAKELAAAGSIPTPKPNAPTEEKPNTDSASAKKEKT